MKNSQTVPLNSTQLSQPVKLLFSTILLSSTFLTPALAQNLSFTSSVSAVTVYPRGAQVSRVATGQVNSGEHVVVVDDLPANIVADSLRVEGRFAGNMEIGSLDVKQVYISDGDNAGERKQLEQEIVSLNDEISRLDQEISDAKTQHALLQRLASQTIAPRTSEGGTLINADELNELLTLTGEKFSQYSKITAKARIAQRQLSQRITDLQNRINELAPKQELKSVIAINLRSDSAGEAEFLIRYNITEAGWAPVYDARLSLGKEGRNSMLKLARRASVHQASSEVWENVELTLSTARPSATTTAPELSPYLLRERRQRQNKKREADHLSDALSMAPAVTSEAVIARAMKPVRKRPAQIVFAGFLAEYKIAGNVTISNTDVEKNVTIATQNIPVEISANTVPKLDPSAYLTASFTLPGKAPLLPGTLILSRDGVHLGKGRLPLLNPGESHELGFGRDDLIKVSRVQVSEKKGESGFISSVNVAERRFVTTIENLHDFPMKVKITDQIPYGTHEDITVEMMKDTTKPDIVDVKKQRGILAWNEVIPAGGKKVVDFGYKVSWPKDMKITPVR